MPSPVAVPTLSHKRERVGGWRGNRTWLLEMTRFTLPLDGTLPQLPAEELTD